MPSVVQVYSCPRCRRGEFRSLPGADGKAFCPWCGESVGGGSPPPEHLPTPTTPMEAIALSELAERIAASVAAPPAAPPPPDVSGRLAEAERGRERAEAELRREQEKRQEIKTAVLAEMSRLEAQLTETKERVRRKDEEHAASLEVLARLKEAREAEWATERKKLQDALAEKELASKGLEGKLEEQRKASGSHDSALATARAEGDKLRAEIAAAGAEHNTLRKKLAAADARLQPLKEAEARQRELKQQLQEATAKAAGLQGEIDKRDRRIKELQMLIKTLGDRLNDLADRRFAAPPKPGP